MSAIEDLGLFHAWLLRRGLSAGTAQVYVSDVGLALRHPRGPRGKLTDGNLAPKTKHRIRSSLRSWARFQKDGDLRFLVDDQRLPPSQRVTVKQPLPREEWLRLINHVRKDEKLDEPMRAVLLLMAQRGFRCGDVLRLERAQVVAALRDGEIIFKAKGSKFTQWSIKRCREPLEILAALDGWKTVLDLVSPTTKSAELRVNAHLRRIAAQQGIDAKDIYTHRLRRTVAVEFLRSMGSDPEALQKLKRWMNWSNIATALEYTDFVNKDALDAAEDKMWGDE